MTPAAEARRTARPFWRRGGPSMKSTRLVAAAIGVAAVMWATATPGAPAHAALALISPGDGIDTDRDTCTLGYALTAGDHSYAITAGHCLTSPGQQVRDRRSGATGTFLRAVVDPPRSGGADFGLIDFGPQSLALPLLGNLALSPVPDLRPRPGQLICRTGITTGTRCGTIVSTYGPNQYLTDMTTSRGGDSGAPVWAPRSGSHAAIIGIWLGGYTTATGADYGRFACLTDAFDTLGVRD